MSSRIADGSWELTVYVADHDFETTVRVKGDMHIGGLMLRIVEGLDLTVDWSDYGLWWQEKGLWLLRTHSTLDQYCVQSDARLQFIPMHNNLSIQLPDLQVVDLQVNFSVNVFSVVVKLCKELGIRHPEELSLARKLDHEELKKNQGISATRRTRPARLRNSTSSSGSHHMSNTSLLLDGSGGGGGSIRGSIYNTNSPSRFTPGRRTPRGTLMRTYSTPISPFSTRSPYSPCTFNANNSMTPGSVNSLFFGTGPSDSALANSPWMATSDALSMLYRPKSFAEKARINAGWLDSSRTLMEQGIHPNSLVQLKFKFFNFYDLNPKYDSVRINQIFEQAKWSILSEELDCTKEEMLVFAALQLQVQIQSQNPQSETNGSAIKDEDLIDAALNDLQLALEGTTLSNNSDITQVPELCEYLKFFKPKRFWFRNYKRYFFLFKDTCLSMYRSSSDVHNSEPQWTLNLKGCDVTGDVLITTSKFNIKILIPSTAGITELWIKAENGDQYARWMAAFRLACKGKTMADSSFDSEIKSIQSLLTMQRRPVSSVPSISRSTSQLNIQPQDFVAPRFFKKLKAKQLYQRILDAHGNVQNLGLNESKMTYIRAWQALPDHGLSYFIIKFKGSRKEELLGIGFNRMLLLDMASGETQKTWRFQNMKTWSVNWEIKQVQVSFEEEDLNFHCLTADCKVIHEFIGGYIFLSMRSNDRSQMLNEELFHKLTGGWL